MTQRNEVCELLRANWSPEQIAAMLPVLFPRHPRMRVSHETIYQSLCVQTNASSSVSDRACAEPGAASQDPDRRREAPPLGISDDIWISKRPADADDRAVPGHSEGDHLIGTGKGAVVTLVERSSRFVLLAPLPGRHTAEIAWMTLSGDERQPAVGAAQVDHLRPRLGSGQHVRFRIETGFRSTSPTPKRRSSAAPTRTHGLLPPCWPQGADLRHLTMTECDDVALRLNTRPRRTLDWQTPGQALNKELVPTAV